MSTDNLDSLSEAELSERVAVECAGWTKREPWPGCGRDAWHDADDKWQLDDQGEYDANPAFATDANSVLPLMETHDIYPEILRPWKDLTTEGAEARRVWEVRFDSVWATAPTFSRACCLALLRAARAGKGAA